MGLVASLNEGIELAHGEWIAKIDADDISLPHRFERQLQWLKTTGADIIGSWFQHFGASDKRIIKMPETGSTNKIQLLFGVPFAHSTVMMNCIKLIFKCTPAFFNIDMRDRAAAEAGMAHDFV